jgi:cytochrome c oxidase subunit 2
MAGGANQSILAPESDAARSIADLWWIMMIGAWIVLGVVVLLVVLAVLRRRSGGGGGGRRLVFLGGIATPIVVLSALFGLTLATLPETSPAGKHAALTVDVVAKQWFWEARYPGTSAVTANEIHIPAGIPVRFRVTSDDVVHSLWVPQLNRKIDVIPGRTNEVILEARRPGVYRGQCAEYCGLQHAHMALLVYADPPARFRRWLASEAAPARTADAQGRAVFAAAGCAGCHAIRGTDADARLGPDLTHLAARATLASVTVPMTRLREWIADPQHVKPGNRMPTLPLRPGELQALVRYLEELR